MDYKHCTLCPRSCKVDRTSGGLGFCRCPDTALIAKTMLHHWEEPALAGSGGSGAIVWHGDKVVSGVIIRHLILPGHVENSLKVLDWIGEHFAPGEVLVSLMRQYTPMGGLPAPMDRCVSQAEYEAVLSWMYLNDLQGFTQEANAADTAFIPDFS